MLFNLSLSYLTPTSTPYIINKRKFVDCICQCGNKTTVRVDKLKSGHTRSCGCMQKEAASKTLKTHGLSKTRIYKIWSSMKTRCYRESHISYASYGGRGITICNDWLNNPMSFIGWASNNGYSPELELDRKDNDKNYSPDNCRWITHAENSRNTRLLRSTNTSGYRGVSLYKATGKYKASITYNYKSIHIGYFATALEGSNARDMYIITHNLDLPLNNPL